MYNKQLKTQAAMRVTSLLNLIMLLLTLPITSIAQTFQTEKYEYNKDFHVGPGYGVTVECTGTEQYRINEENQRVLHGKRICNGSNIENYFDGRLKIKGSYSSTINYSDGVLDGGVTIRQNYQLIMNGQPYTANNSFSGSFNKGVPDGEWKFEESGNLNPYFEFRNNIHHDIFGNATGMNLSSNGQSIAGKRSRNIIVKFKNGKIVSLMDNESCNRSLNDYGIMESDSGKYNARTEKISDQNNKKIIESIIDDNGQFTLLDLTLQGYYLSSVSKEFDYEFVTYVRLSKILDQIIYYCLPGWDDFYNSYEGHYVDIYNVFKIPEEDFLTSYDEAVEWIGNPSLEKYERNLANLKENGILYGKFSKYVNKDVYVKMVSYLTKKVEELRQQQELNDKVKTYRETLKEQFKYKSGESNAVLSYNNIRESFWDFYLNSSPIQATEDDLSYLERFDKFLKNYQNILEKTDVIIVNYNKIKDDAGKDYSDVFKAYSNVYKMYNFAPIFKSLDEYDEYAAKIESAESEQKMCLQFISLRKEISETKANIDSHKKECKNIVAVHDEYLKNADVSWASDSASIEKLKNIIANQGKFLQAVTSNNASDYEMSVKRMKDKSLDAVLKVFAQ